MKTFKEYLKEWDNEESSLPLATFKEYKPAIDLANKQADERGELGMDRNNLPIESVPLNNIRVTQKGVSKERIDHYRDKIKNGSLNIHGHSIKYKGIHYVTDGHHRVEAAIREGKSHVNLSVVHARVKGY